jgi:hypothetical protein
MGLSAAMAEPVARAITNNNIPIPIINFFIAIYSSFPYYTMVNKKLAHLNRSAEPFGIELRAKIFK